MYRRVHYSTVVYMCTVQYSRVQVYTVQYSTVVHVCTVQYCTGEPREQVQVDPLPLGLRKAQPGPHSQPDRDSGREQANMENTRKRIICTC